MKQGGQKGQKWRQTKNIGKATGLVMFYWPPLVLVFPLVGALPDTDTCLSFTASSGVRGLARSTCLYAAPASKPCQQCPVVYHPTAIQAQFCLNSCGQKVESNYFCGLCGSFLVCIGLRKKQEKKKWAKMIQNKKMRTMQLCLNTLLKPKRTILTSIQGQSKEWWTTNTVETSKSILVISESGLLNWGF